MWIALYINCVNGRFVPYGPFDTEGEAAQFILVQPDPRFFSAFEVIRTDWPKSETSHKSS